MYRTIILVLGVLSLHAAETTLTIPAFTAYCQPNPKGVHISDKKGVDGWSDATQQIAWHGRFIETGTLDARIRLTLKASETVTLQLHIDGQSEEATVTGKDNELIELSFKPFTIRTSGWHHCVLTGLKKSGATFGQLDSLILSGPAVKDAHFNIKPRRNAASVHLGYPTQKEDEIVAFYNEVTVRTDPLWSYYMACGFNRGYFGIQVNSPTERRIIFSVWDSGNEAVDRKKVAAQDRVQLIGKGENVITNDFGNEGTGGHSHLVYPWVVGTTYKFIVTAKPHGDHTDYSGWFFFPETNKWSLIATFSAPKDGKYLHGLYSFNENFSGTNGDLQRFAEFGNQWVRSKNDIVRELTTARFTHDVTGKADRFDYSSGVIEGRRFFLSNGGFVGGDVKGGTLFNRPPTPTTPSILLENWKSVYPNQ